MSDNIFERINVVNNARDILYDAYVGTLTKAQAKILLLRIGFEKPEVDTLLDEIEDDS